MAEPTTPEKPDEKKRKLTHYSTLKKAGVRGIVSFLEAQGIPYSKPDVFEHFEIRSQSAGYKILNDSSRTRHNNPFHEETRGTKPLNEDQIQTICQMFEDGIEKGDGDAQWLAPESVCFEMGYNIDKKRTFQRAIIEETEFRRCIACRNDGPRRLLDLLDSAWRLGASDPRDKSFALLGLVKDEVRADIPSDYTKSVHKVYIDVARFLIRTERDFYIFSYAGLGNVGQLGLPPPFSANGCRTHKEVPTDDPGSLTCRGLRLDRVSHVHDLHRRIFYPDGRQYRTPSQRRFFATADEAGLIVQDGYTAKEYEHTYFQILSVGTSARSSRLSDIGKRMSFPVYCDHEERGLLHEDSGPEKVWQEAMDSISQRTIDRKLFITYDRRIRLGPKDLQLRDVVAVLFGGEVPFILRPVVENRKWSGEYLLVGECYVEYIMDGEAIEDAEEKDFEDFVIY